MLMGRAEFDAAFAIGHFEFDQIAGDKNREDPFTPRFGNRLVRLLV